MCLSQSPLNFRLPPPLSLSLQMRLYEVVTYFLAVVLESNRFQVYRILPWFISFVLESKCVGDSFTTRLLVELLVYSSLTGT